MPSNASNAFQCSQMCLTVIAALLSLCQSYLFACIPGHSLQHFYRFYFLKAV